MHATFKVWLIFVVNISDFQCRRYSCAKSFVYLKIVFPSSVIIDNESPTIDCKIEPGLKGIVWDRLSILNLDSRSSHAQIINEASQHTHKALAFWKVVRTVYVVI